jgi:hypothetical protein
MWRRGGGGAGRVERGDGASFECGLDVFGEVAQATGITYPGFGEGLGVQEPAGEGGGEVAQVGCDGGHGRRGVRK